MEKSKKKAGSVEKVEKNRGKKHATGRRAELIFSAPLLSLRLFVVHLGVAPRALSRAALRLLSSFPQPQWLFYPRTHQKCFLVFPALEKKINFLDGK